MLTFSSTERFDVDSPNPFLATALSFEREATRVSRELHTNLNRSAFHMANR
jgi:hypothetical protein